MSEKVTWVSAASWMRHQFANWLASVTVFSFLWLAVGIAVGVLFVWDGVWSRHQAPSNLDPLTFQGAGWVMRLWTVFALAGAVWCFRHRARVPGAIMAFTWVLTSLMTFGHALGFVATGQQERYALAASVEKVEAVAVTSAEQQIETLERQKDGIRSDRDAAVAGLEAAIQSILNDGINNDHLADDYRKDIATTQTEAGERIKAIDAQILAILSSKQEAKTVAASEVENTVKFDPLYILLAEWTDGQPGPPRDEDIRHIAQMTGAFWALLLEMIGGAGPALLYAIHAHAAEKRTHIRTEHSEDLPPGTTVWKGTDEEWQEIEAALKAHRNIKEGARKGAKTRRQGNKVEAADVYYRNKISEFMSLHNQGLATVDIAAKYGLTVAVLRISYGPYMSEEEYTALFASAPKSSDNTPEGTQEDEDNGPGVEHEPSGN